MAGSTDGLTPREREVLALLRRGLTNEEIAQSLGISLAGVKYHVSEILSKLGVATRHEAAALTESPRRWWADVPLWAKAGGLAVTAAAIAGIAVLLWAVISTTSEDGSTSAGVTPECPHDPGGFEVEWVDFVRLNGVFYQSLERTRAEVRLGERYGTVRCKLSGHEPVAARQVDGDAAYLEPGTVLYEISGYDPAFRLAAILEGGTALYEADQNPDARLGRDLLDIEGKVTRIGIASQLDGVTELATIADPEQVGKLVELVSEAPVDQTYRDQGEADYFVVFHLIDGSPAVRRAYWLSSGELSRGIILPDEFRQAVEAAVPGS